MFTCGVLLQEEAVKSCVWEFIKLGALKVRILLGHFHSPGCSRRLLIYN